MTQLSLSSRTAARLSLIVFCLLGAAFIHAANHFVRQGATGNGSDWINACADFTGPCAVASLVRGDTYYVADGSYAGRTWNRAESGVSVITIKKAAVVAAFSKCGLGGSYVILINS